MFKTALVHISGNDCDGSTLAAGLEVVRPFAGHLSCLRVVPNSAALFGEVVTVDMGTSMMQLAVREQQERERTREAHARMDEFCKSQNIAVADVPPGPGQVSAAWQETTAADEVDAIIAQAPFYDVLVLAGGPERPGRIPEGGLGSIILGSGRPVVLAPERPICKPIKTVAVAWKSCAESARAVTAAMPLLAQASRIDVLSANEGDSEIKGCVECCERIVRQLRWHDLNAYSHFVIPAGRTAPEAILETARDFDADLLVMGAYGHSRMRELIFGGFTRRILRGTGLPVFLFH